MTGRPAGCRTMDCDWNSVSFNFKEGEDPSYPNVFSRPLTLQEIDMKMVSPVSGTSSSVLFFIFYFKASLCRRSTPETRSRAGTYHPAKRNPSKEGGGIPSAIW